MLITRLVMLNILCLFIITWINEGLNIGVKLLICTFIILGAILEAVVTLNYRIYVAKAHLNLAIMAVILSVPMPSAVESAHISSRRHSTGGHIF